MNLIVILNDGATWTPFHRCCVRIADPALPGYDDGVDANDLEDADAWTWELDNPAHLRALAAYIEENNV
jgi:hypothetical protein